MVLHTIMLLLRVTLGVIVGAFVGGAAGFYGAMGLGIAFQFLNPRDPSAGSVAIIVIATLPGGVIFGALAGGTLGALFPRPKQPTCNSSTCRHRNTLPNTPRPQSGSSLGGAARRTMVN